ncbi:hypothetical protein NA78x_002067 [Anatilimnocola sp. NA78]
MGIIDAGFEALKSNQFAQRISLLQQLFGELQAELIVLGIGGNLFEE